MEMELRLQQVEQRVLGPDSILEKTHRKVEKWRPLVEGDFDANGIWQDGVLQKVQRGQERNRELIAFVAVLIPPASAALTWLLNHWGPR